jgi:acyl dehydratase
MLAMNTNELHFNEEAARASEWGQVLVNSTFTLSVVLGLSVRDTTEAGGVNLGWKEIRLPKPVFIGDTLRAETEVLSVRESASRPSSGVVEVRTRGLNQRDEIVCDFERSFLIPKRA